MTAREAIKLLTKSRANWRCQPIDALTAAEWREILTRVDYADGLAALINWRDSGGLEPPPPGLIYREARNIAHRREQEKRRRTRQLGDLRPNDCECAKIHDLAGEFLRRTGNKN
jgi:hypothetical protein